MRVRIYGTPKKVTKELVKSSMLFFLDYFALLGFKNDVNIKFNKDFILKSKKLDGNCVWQTTGNFDIETLSDAGKRKILLTLAHEAVHIKQQLYCQLDGTGFNRTWMGKPYIVQDEEEHCFGVPWEIEARGYEILLYRAYTRSDEYNKIFFAGKDKPHPKGIINVSTNTNI